jgi:hypothetical protein
LRVSIPRSRGEGFRSLLETRDAVSGAKTTVGHEICFCVAPKSAVGIAVRNVVTRPIQNAGIADYFIGRDLRDDMRLPDYGF